MLKNLEKYSTICDIVLYFFVLYNFICTFQQFYKSAKIVVDLFEEQVYYMRMLITQ